jgi:hypothetical protein
MGALDLSHEKLCICLFSFEGANSGEYKKLLSSLNVRVVYIEKEEHCQILLESVKFNGILVDIPTHIKSSAQTKEFIYKLSGIYPAARIRYNRENDNMEMFLIKEMQQISLPDFLVRCSLFIARRIRRHDRININLNLRIFYEYESKPTQFLCTSANISKDGLFVMNIIGNLPVGVKVKIQILELGKDNFLHGTVVRLLEWGEKLFHAPGFGIRIDNMDREIFMGYIELLENSTLR